MHHQLPQYGDDPLGTFIIKAEFLHNVLIQVKSAKYYGKKP